MEAISSDSCSETFGETWELKHSPHLSPLCKDLREDVLLTLSPLLIVLAEGEWAQVQVPMVTQEASPEWDTEPVSSGIQAQN